MGMQLDEHQVQAVKEAVRNGLWSSQVVRVQVRQLRSIRSSDILRWKAWTFSGGASGRAAKRMSETTGFEARTIHRMLELNGGMEGSADGT